jgi:hypothetical protein
MWAPVGADDNSSGAGNVLVAPFRQNADGKWDLTQYNDQYFGNLASQLDYAASKGVYVQVMLLADYNVPYGGATWAGSFWNGGNNVNGTTSDNVALNTLGGGAPLDLQEAYIAKVLDTIGGRTNVMLEIANEPPPGTVPWQNALADFIHSYQSSHGLPANPVVESATFPHFGSENDNAALLNSPADVVELDHWQSTPGNSIYDLPGPGAKPEIVMTDHSGTEADSSAMFAAVGKGYGWEIMGVPNGWGLPGVMGSNNYSDDAAITDEISNFGAVRAGAPSGGQMATISLPDPGGPNSGSADGGSVVPPTGGTPQTVTMGSGTDTISVDLSADIWRNAPQVSFSVDGQQIGGTQTVTALHSQDLTQVFNLEGAFGNGQHTVTVNFLNDEWDGGSGDTNVYVDSINGQGVGAAQFPGGPADYTATVAGSSSGGSQQSPSGGSGNASSASQEAIVLYTNSDNPGMQFEAFIDGQDQGTFTTTASHATDATDQFNFQVSAADHTLTVQELTGGSLYTAIEVGPDVNHHSFIGFGDPNPTSGSASIVVPHI